MSFAYSANEKIIMAIITGLSHFSWIPCIKLMIIQERIFEFLLGFFTIIFSIIYHITDSLNVTFYIEPTKWHVLDNIGAICCLTSVIIYFLHGDKEKKHLILNVFSLFLVMTVQTSDPWNLFNTIIPIVLFFFILVLDLIINGIPEINNCRSLYIGFSITVVAIVMFIIGLDDNSDYLRIFHSLWHMTIGFSNFFLRQSKEKNFYNINDVFKSKNTPSVSRNLVNDSESNLQL